MPITDLFYIFRWWFVLFLVGLIFLPLTTVIFANFFDRGYIFAKILGLGITTYILFLLSTLQALPFSLPAIFFVLIASFIFNIFLTTKNPSILTSLRSSWKIFLFEEALFFIVLLCWSFVRAHEPSIHGLEKFMDFGFVNSVLHTSFFPAKDLWLAPESINYYYFGHVQTAVLIKLSGIKPEVSYNLMIATLCAFTFSGSFSIGANLIRSVLAGFLTAFLVTFAGNLHAIYAFFKSYNTEHPVAFWQLAFSPETFPNAYWYPNATRFIANTIHEFPIYSFVVSDLHGHVLDIPFVLLIIAVLLQIVILRSQSDEGSKILRFASNDMITLPLLAFLIAVMYMTNAWDSLIYGGLTFLVFAYLAYKSGNYTLYAIRYLVVIAAAIVTALPFSLYFKPFASGIGILCAPEFLTNIGKLGPFLFEPNHCQHSPWWQLLILYGVFYFWVVVFFLNVILRKQSDRRISRFFANAQNDIFIILLILLSMLLILTPEFVYAKDIYPAHYRANTMFKLVYQAFIMLSIVSGYVITLTVLGIKYRVLSINQKILTTCSILLATSFLLIVFIYPYFAITSYYGNLQTYQGLDGLSYLGKLYPNDYEAILWIKENIKDQPVILEAQGDSYTDYARVSANTGLPTVIGWPVHEWLWRGSYDVAAPRIADVQTLYETNELPIAAELIKRYKIQLIFVGDLERQKYPNLSEVKFGQLGKLIHQSGQTRIYQINDL